MIVMLNHDFIALLHLQSQHSTIIIIMLITAGVAYLITTFAKQRFAVFFDLCDLISASVCVRINAEKYATPPGVIGYLRSTRILALFCPNITSSTHRTIAKHYYGKN